ncbi:MAG: hypothetical protein Q9217_006736 [Psora testacea]
MTTVAPANLPSCGRKRKRTAAEEEHSTIAATSPQPPWKRAKKPFQSQQEANTAYWDSLSKLWCTRRALKELDRRNRQTAIPVRITAARRLDLGREPDPLKYPSKQLKRFSRYGGPDLRDLTGVNLARDTSRSLLISSLQFPEPATPNLSVHVMPSNQSRSRTQSKSRNTLDNSTAKTTTSKTKKTSPYDPNFEQNLIDNSVYPDDYDFPDGRDPPKPNNENEILDRLGRPRPSLSPSQLPEKAFRSFKQKNSRALNEDAVMAEVFPMIQGNAHIPSAKNIAFGNLEPLTHGNLVDAKPDSYDGAPPAQIHRRIREELGSYITPSTQQQAPALPNFFTEVKGPDGSAAVAKRQACYNGALGARAVQKLQGLGQEPIYDNNAYTITSTYHDGTLKIYTVHSTQAADLEDSHEYHMTQLRSFATTDTPESFRQGVGAFRNARDWTKEQRDKFIAAANGRLIDMPMEASTLGSSSHSMSQSTTEPVFLESETSADELSQDVIQGPSLFHKRLKREPEKRSSKSDLRTRPKKSYSAANSRSRSRGRLS